MPNLTIVALVLLGLYLLGWLPQELQDVIGALTPWAPLLVALYFLQSAVGDVLKGAWRMVETFVKFIVSAIFAAIFLIFVFPIMLADTFLLGSMAQWMWKFQVGPLLLVIASGMALGLIRLWEGKLSYEFSKRFLASAMILGVALIVWGYVSESWTNTHRLIFTIRGGRVFADPAGSVQVKAGDVIRFSAFGRAIARVGGTDVPYPPQGDLFDPLGPEETPRGQIQLVVRDRAGTEQAVPVTNVTSGERTIAGIIDLGYYTGGYYAEAEAKIPARLAGRLKIAFVGVTPHSGTMRLTLQLNPHRSFIGRMLAHSEYLGVLGMLGLGLAVFGGLAALNHFLVPKEMGALRFWLNVAAVVFFLATIAAATAVTGVSPWQGIAKSIGFGSFGFGWGSGSPCRGHTIVAVSPGQTRRIDEWSSPLVPAGCAVDFEVVRGTVALSSGGAPPQPIEGKGVRFPWRSPMVLSGDGAVAILLYKR